MQIVQKLRLRPNLIKEGIMTKKQYIDMLRAEYRLVFQQIVELEKRKNQIHEQLEEVMDSEALKKWEVKEYDNKID